MTLREVDQAWVQQNLHLLGDFTRTLTRDYAAPLASIDFTNTERAADTINRWVSDKTNGKIPKLVTPDVLDAAELVLTDAVYLDAKWEHGFDPKLTKDEPFHLGDGSTASVPTMHQTEHLDTATGAGWTAVAIPYKGNALEMDVIVPDDLARFEQDFGPARLDEIVAGMKPVNVALSLPKFEFRTHFDNLKGPLGALGVRDAFDPNRADFSAMTGGATCSSAPWSTRRSCTSTSRAPSPRVRPAASWNRPRRRWSCPCGSTSRSCSSCATTQPGRLCSWGASPTRARAERTQVAPDCKPCSSQNSRL